MVHYRQEEVIEEMGTMTEISTAEARDQFSEIVNKAAYGKERMIVTRRGKALAALIPIEDLRILEEMEDRKDVEDAKRILAEAKAKNEKPVSYLKARKELGLA
jgi:prevent-host-death family protein